MQIFNTADVGNNGVKVLCYGKSGVGKTRLASTAQAPFVISAESGLLSLRRFTIPYTVVRKIEDVYDAYNFIAKSHEARMFNDIFLDSISEIMETLLAAEKAVNKDPRKAYGNLIDGGISLVKAFRDIPAKNIWILAKEELVKDDTTGVSSYQPMIPGSKLGPALPYYFDEVFRYEVGVNNTTTPPSQWEALRAKASFNATAKDRSGMLDEYEPANVYAITNKILGRKV